MAKKAKNRVLRTVMCLGVTGLISAAVVDQLRRPVSERTWQGKIWGVPYDFRAPTAEKFRNTVWNKETSELFVPQAFGMGWTINFYPLVHPKTVVKEIEGGGDTP